MAASLAGDDRAAFRAAALAAVALMPADMRGPGSIHRAIEVEWRRLFRPPAGSMAEVLATRVSVMRLGSLAG